MANSNKTKAEMLQELESIKGLLLEEDDIPILQTIDHSHGIEGVNPQPGHTTVLPGQTSLFDDIHTNLATEPLVSPTSNAHLSNQKPAFGNATEISGPRPLAKASGENPFLPQHIRERLHGNNPPPLFEYETAKKIVSATKNIANKMNKPRQTLVDEVVNGLLPQIEAELRHRLFAMSVEDLEKLLNEDDE